MYSTFIFSSYRASRVVDKLWIIECDVVENYPERALDIACKFKDDLQWSSGNQYPSGLSDVFTGGFQS